MTTVVHVITRFLDGGSERRVIDLVSALPDHTHVVVVGRQHDSDRIERELPAARVVVCPRLDREIAPGLDALALVELRRILRRERPAIVHTCQSKANLLGRLAVRGLRPRPTVISSVVMELTARETGRGIGFALRHIERGLALSTDAYLVPAESLASSVPASARTRCRTMRVALALPDGPTERRDRNHLVFIGALSERKRPLDAVRVLPILDRLTGDRWRLTMMGDGPLQDIIRQEATALGVSDRVNLLGHVRDVTRELVPGRIVILLSEAEGLPQVLVQAAASGVAFVATDCVGTRELVELGAKGALVPLGDLMTVALSVIEASSWDVPSTFDTHAWTEPAVHTSYRVLLQDLSAC